MQNNRSTSIHSMFFSTLACAAAMWWGSVVTVTAGVLGDPMVSTEQEQQKKSPIMGSGQGSSPSNAENVEAKDVAALAETSPGTPGKAVVKSAVALTEEEANDRIKAAFASLECLKNRFEDWKQIVHALKEPDVRSADPFDPLIQKIKKSHFSQNQELLAAIGQLHQRPSFYDSLLGLRFCDNPGLSSVLKVVGRGLPSQGSFVNMGAMIDTQLVMAGLLEGLKKEASHLTMDLPEDPILDAGILNSLSEECNQLSVKAILAKQQSAKSLEDIISGFQTSMQAVTNKLEALRNAQDSQVKRLKRQADWKVQKENLLGLFEKMSEETVLSLPCRASGFMWSNVSLTVTKDEGSDLVRGLDVDDFKGKYESPDFGKLFSEATWKGSMKAFGAQSASEVKGLGVNDKISVCFVMGYPINQEENAGIPTYLGLCAEGDQGLLFKTVGQMDQTWMDLASASGTLLPQDAPKPFVRTLGDCLVQLTTQQSSVKSPTASQKPSNSLKKKRTKKGNANKRA